jgi:trehalose utilization protein
MYQVVITLSSGRIQRKVFNDLDAAWRCADKWSEKNVKTRTYTVTVEHVKPVATTAKQPGRSAAM